MATDTASIDFAQTTRPRVRWALAAFAALAALALLLLIARPLRVLPRLAPAPSYSLIDQTGQPLSDADLRGKIVLYDFVYTHCGTVCPAMTAQMLQVQRRLDEAGLLGEEVVLVTMTFDPERDTPERLREYAAQMRADPRGWLWLTGDPLAIRQLVGGEFGVYFERVESHPADAHGTGHAHGAADDSYDFVHATVFVLVDGEGTIRAEYHEMLDVDRAMRDITLALREQRADGPLAVLWQAAHLMRAYP